MPRPQVSSLSPTIGVAGTQVTVTGVNFGASQGSSVVTFNGTAGTVLSWSNSIIVVSVPNGASTGNVVVTVSGLASNGQLFTIPVISNINPFDGPPGILLTIAGSGFGATRGSGTAMIGNTPITVFTWTDSQIVGAVAPGTQSGNVTVQQGSLTITGPAFTVDTDFPYTITPQSLSMVVGDSRTVSAVDSQGNQLNGLDWFATDPTIVSLSTDDPPVITALAPGSVTVYAGDVPLPINVYASISAIPPGTPIWSSPVSGTVNNIVPAIPIPGSDVDVYAYDSNGNITAFASDGTRIWQHYAGPTDKLIPDFSGNIFLREPYSYQGTDGQGDSVVYQTHRIWQMDPAGNLKNIYTFSSLDPDLVGSADSLSRSNYPQAQVAPNQSALLSEDGWNPQRIIPDTTGVLFVQDLAKVSVIDIASGNTINTINLELSTGVDITIPGYPAGLVLPITGQMIVAGDGNAYVSYAYSNTRNSPDGSSSQIVSTFNLLRVSPDGSYAKVQLSQQTLSTTGIGTNSPVSTGCGVGVGASTSTTQDPTTRQFVGTDPSDPPGPISVITNGNTGVAVFSGPVACAGQPNTAAETAIRVVANDSITSQAQFPVAGFVPALQQEDGSYIGTDLGHNPTAVDLGGNVLWQNTSLGIDVAPQYATGDARAIFSSRAIKLCSQGTEQCAPFTNTPTQYTFDQYGNLASQLADVGAKPSWTGGWYGTTASSLTAESLLDLSLASTWVATVNGNHSYTSASNQQTDWAQLVSCLSNKASTYEQSICQQHGWSDSTGGPREWLYNGFKSLAQLLATPCNPNSSNPTVQQACNIDTNVFTSKLKDANGNQALRTAFLSYLGKSEYPAFYDGTASTVEKCGWIEAPFLCDSVAVKDDFAHQDATNAALFTLAAETVTYDRVPPDIPRMKAFFLPGAIYREILTSSAPHDADNMALIFHEALHAYTRLSDSGLKGELGCDPDSNGSWDISYFLLQFTGPVPSSIEKCSFFDNRGSTAVPPQ